MDVLRKKHDFNASDFFRKKLIEQYPEQYKTIVEDQTPQPVYLPPSTIQLSPVPYTVDDLP